MSAQRNPAHNALDGAIIRALAKRPQTFTGLLRDEVLKQCRAIEEKTGSELFRVLDRRLQALRKAGSIRYRRGPNAAWELAE